jgi:protein-tyrosine phosphatase
MGGLGRSGMIAACTLVDAGLSPTAAIASVRAARGPRALETSEQEEFVSRFAAS